MKNLLLLVLLGAASLCAFPRESIADNNHVKIEMVRSYPELRVDGKPFFIHSAAFFYSRLPRDQWEKSLRRHAELGINTLDLYLQWNWHEPQEGQFDFDGHTNPRRDLQSLLAMSREMGFKLIIRPGPVILNEWKNGGYPDWLLTRPEYQESLQDVLEGRYPRLSGLSPTQSEDASRQWLANATHLQYTRQWFMAVMKVLAPYLASHDGNILFFQLDDDQAINRVNYNGPEFWRYMNTLRQDLEEAAISVGGKTDDIIPFINPTDMRVSAAGFNPAFPKPIAALGQWYMSAGNGRLSFEESTNLKFFVEELKTEPSFPPMMIEFQAGWYVSGDDTQATKSLPENTLLSSRTLFAHGLRGLNYFPLQDTLYPAGYEVPWTNHYYTWDAALDVNSNEQPRGIFVRRNGNLLRGMGPLLAQTHQHADVGIVYALGAYEPQDRLTKEEIRGISSQAISLQRALMISRISSEFFDPAYQSLDQLKRQKLLLMPVTTFSSEQRIAWIRSAEEKLVAFVESGGTLVFFPKAPESGLLSEWFTGLKRKVGAYTSDQTILFTAGKLPPLHFSGEIESYEEFAGGAVTGGGFQPLAQMGSGDGSTAVAIERRVGAGKVVVLGWDFSRPSQATKKDSTSPIQFNVEGRDSDSFHPLSTTADADTVFSTLLMRGAVERALNWSDSLEQSKGRAVDAQLELFDDCSAGGFLSVVNFSESDRDLNISVSRGAGCLLPTQLPPVHLFSLDALLLPVHLPLRYFIKGMGNDEIISSNAELALVEGDSDRFHMGFYSPMASEVILKLDRPEEYRFKTDEDMLKVLPSGQPGWIRVPVPAYEEPLPIRMVYVERVKGRGVSRPEPSVDFREGGRGSLSTLSSSVVGRKGDGVRVNLHSGYRLPIRGALTMPLDPPIVSLDNTGPSRLFLDLENPISQTVRYSIEFHVNGYRLTPSLKKVSVGPFSTEEYEFNLYLFLKGIIDPKIKFSKGVLLLKGHGELLHREFYMLTLDPGTAEAYALDLDRDGFPEVVMENSELRLVVTPNAGARSFVLIDKRTDQNVFTSVGAFRDKFEFNHNQPNRTLSRQIRGYFGLFNRPYQYEIVTAGEATAAVRFFYDAPDVAPAGALVQKTVTLHAGERFFEVEYQITPHGFASDIPQAFISSNSVSKSFSESESGLKLEPVGPLPYLLEKLEVRPKDSSSEILLLFKRFDPSTPTYSYRIRYRLPAF